MSSWWRRRSFKVRLTLWYAAVISAVLTVFAIVVYEIVEHRMEGESDRQLRIDFDIVEAQLDMDAENGRIHWAVQGAHGDEGFARLFAWFEVWSEDGKLLLRHWPIPESKIKRQLREVWRSKLESLPPAHDFVLIVRPGLVEGIEAKGFDWLGERVDEVLGKAAA